MKFSNSNTFSQNNLKKETSSPTAGVYANYAGQPREKANVEEPE